MCLSEAPFVGVSVVDPEPGARVEEMQRARVDRDLDGSPSATRERAPNRPTMSRGASFEPLDASTSPVSSASSRTSSVDRGLRLDREMHHDLRAESLGQFDGALRRLSAGVSEPARRPRDPPGGCRDHGFARVSGRPGRAASFSAPSAIACVADASLRSRRSRRSSVASIMFIAGLADEPADEQVHGPVVERLRVGHLLQLAPCA